MLREIEQQLLDLRASERAVDVIDTCAEAMRRGSDLLGAMVDREPSELHQFTRNELLTEAQNALQAGIEKLVTAVLVAAARREAMTHQASLPTPVKPIKLATAGTATLADVRAAKNGAKVVHAGQARVN